MEATYHIPSHLLDSTISFKTWWFNGTRKGIKSSPIDLIEQLLTITRAQGLDKASTNESYITLFNRTQTLLSSSPKVEGTLELLKSNTLVTTPSAQFRVSGRVKVTKLCYNPDPKRSFKVKVTPYQDTQLTVTLSHLSILLSNWCSSVSKLSLTKEGSRYPLNIAFRTDLTYTVSEFTLGLPMENHKRNGVFVSTGYPSAKLFNQSNLRKVSIGGEAKMLPTAFPRDEIHYSALPDLLKPGTIIKAEFKVDWVLEDGILKLLVKVCNGNVIIKPFQGEDIELLRLLEQFGDEL